MNIIPVKLSVTTCYLISTDKGYILVGTGYEEDRELFLAGLKKAGGGRPPDLPCARKTV